MTWALGVLQSIQSTSLLDIGSGRGTFLWPLLDTFPMLPVTAVDADADRFQNLRAVQLGGVETLQVQQVDATALPFADGHFDVVTLLELLKHIPNAEAALAEAVRVARRFLLISVPAKADDNPKYIQLFDEARLRRMLADCGITRRLCRSSIWSAGWICSPAPKWAMPCRQRCGFIHEEEFGVAARRHHGAAASFEVKQAGDPALALVGPRYFTLRIVQHTTVAHERAAGGRGDDLSGWRHAVLEGQNGLPAELLLAQ